MAKRNRDTLKNYFRQGCRPTEQTFADLVDSSLNILDDGFGKTPGTGVALAPAAEKETVVSFLEKPDDTIPLWEIALGSKDGSLLIRRVNGEVKTPLLTLHTNGTVELGEQGYPVTLPGGVHIPTRTGSLLKGEVPANGHWHDIQEMGTQGYLVTKEWTDIQALEIVAAAEGPAYSRMAVTTAIATTCNGHHCDINDTASRHGGCRSGIRLRWKPLSHRKQACKLQLRTGNNYGPGAMIRFHISSIL